MATLELPVPLDDILQTKQVEVVQSLDVGALKTLLKWIVDQLGQPSKESTPGDLGRLEQLENDNEQLKQQVAALQAAQDGMRDELGKKLDKVAFEQSELAGMTSQDLPARLKSLEDRIMNMPEPALVSSAGDLPPIPGSAAEGDASVAVSQPSSDTKQGSPFNPIAFEALQHRVDQLEAKASGGGAGGGADVGTIAELQEQLAGKADVADLEALKNRLGEKADRAELDALATAGSSAGLGAEAGLSQPITLADDGTLDMGAVADGLNKALSEVATLRSMLLLLQERMAGKADLGALDDVASGLRSLQLGSSGSAHPSSHADPGSPNNSSSLADLKARLDSLELQMSAGLAPSGEAHSGTQVAVDTSGSLGDAFDHIQQLYDKLGGKAGKEVLEPFAKRLAELGAALSDLEARLGSAGPPTQAVLGLSGIEGGVGVGALSADHAINSEGARSDVAGSGLTGERSNGSAAAGAVGDNGDELAATLAALQDRLSALEMALAGKADQGVIDEMKLRIALGASGMAGGDGEGSGGEGLLETLQGMLAGKANRSELETVKGALARLLAVNNGGRQMDAGEVFRDSGAAPGALFDPASLEQQLKDKAGKDEVIALADQVGNLFEELQSLRSAVAMGPKDAGLRDLLASSQHAAAAQATSAGGATDSQTAQLVNALAKELHAVKDSLDLVAHAANLMSVGPEQVRASPINGAASSPAAANSNGLGLVNGREPRTPRGAMERLSKLLGRQAVGHKMDWFDPETLNRMATRMGQLDALLKNPGAAGVLTGRTLPDQGMKDLELQIKRLARDMRSMKENKADMGGVRSHEGDHAMLSGKPLMGYRCMACDRPLDKLDDKAGPYIPTHQLPVSVAAAPDVNTKVNMARGGGGVLSPEHSSVVSSPSRGSQPLQRKVIYDPNLEKRGPQNWYEDVKGPPADALPTGDVGPKLPPGGWRGNSSSGVKTNSAGLPDIGANTNKPRSQGRSPPRSQAGPVEDHAAIQQGMLPHI